MALAQQKEDLNLKDSAVSQANVSVRNFGPIAKADIKLKPLNIFVGPSNTGKSYLAILLYALQQILSPNQRQYIRMGRSYRIIDNHHNLIRKLKDTGSLPVPIIISTSYDNLIKTIKNDRIFNHFMVRNFGFEDIRVLQRIRSRGFAGVKVGFNTYANKEFHTELIFSLGSEEKIKSKTSPILLESLKLEKDKEILDLATEIAKQLTDKEDKNLIVEHSLLFQRLMEKIISPFSTNIYYLPASRTGIMHSYNIIMSALIGQATYGGLRPSEENIPMFSGVIADFLENLIFLASRKKMSRPIRRGFGRYAKGIEDSILQGKVIIDSVDNHPTFSYKQNDWPNEQIDISKSSSMISELAPLVFYLQSLVISGDTLIIEEPEAHLHPEAQTKLATHIAKLVGAGLRVVITTHSEWLMEKFANLMQKDGSGLKRSDLGVWSFAQTNKSGGTLVKEIKLQEDSDTYPDGFEEVSIALYNEWAESQKKNS